MYSISRACKFTSYQPIKLYRKFTSDKIFNGYELLPSDTVIISDECGEIIDVVPKNQAGEDIQQFNGMISPGFVNCHCHLELSHMKAVIPTKTGLVDFVTQILQKRDADDDSVYSAINAAEKQMIENGIVAVGDICNTNYTIPQKSKTNLHYHNFIEVSGFLGEHAKKRFEQAEIIFYEFTAYSKSNSIVPHAPYSVSKDLLQLIANFQSNNVMTIHNQETPDENDFFRFKKGAFLHLYEKLKINIDFFQPNEKSSIRYFMPFFSSNQPLILVHNVDTSEEDLLFAKNHFKEHDSNLFFCICPNANKYISNQLPDLQMLLKNDCNIVLGTDSLASNNELSILAEMNTLQKNFPNIAVTEMLQWATINGARALKIDHLYGSLEKGKKPGMILINEEKIDRLI